MLRRLMLSVALCASAPAFAIYKCETAGQVSYSDTPCAGGRMLDIGSGSTSDERRAANQAAQEKKLLKRLQDERHKQLAIDEKAHQRAARTEAVRRNKCESLDRRQRWAHEDAALATGKSAERARRKARRADEQFHESCGTLARRELVTTR
jgi:hypothetical protein